MNSPEIDIVPKFFVAGAPQNKNAPLGGQQAEGAAWGLSCRPDPKPARRAGGSLFWIPNTSRSTAVVVADFYAVCCVRLACLSAYISLSASLSKLSTELTDGSALAIPKLAPA